MYVWYVRTNACMYFVYVCVYVCMLCMNAVDVSVLYVCMYVTYARFAMYVCL